MKTVALWFLLMAMLSMNVHAQNYHALEGSPFAGSIGVANNPASILSTPYPWDVTVLSFQIKTATNAVVFHNISLLTLAKSDTISYKVGSGYLKRYAAFNFNLHLLNARIALGKKQAIAFGANLRGYAAVRTGNANYSDTVQNMNQFFDINQGTTYSANMVNNTWLELFGTYSRTIADDLDSRLNVGITLKAMRGISGAFAQLKSGDVGRSVDGLQTIYLLRAGSAKYGYSSNYDQWKDSKSTGQNLKDFLGHTQPGAAFDLGAEYWVKSGAITNVMDDDNYFDYEWKIGVSLLDVGQNVFRYGSQSRAVSNPRSDVSDSALNAKFDPVQTLAQFNDSLATIVNNFSGLTGEFKVWTPARLVINVDRPLPNHFAVNANLSLNLSGSNTGKELYAKEMNLLTVVPRWEKRRIGAYLPVQVTTDGKFWIGGAVKAGPLLLGVHNWGNVFSKNKIQNGGFYLALVIRPGEGFAEKEEKQYTCPKL